VMKEGATVALIEELANQHVNLISRRLTQIDPRKIDRP